MISTYNNSCSAKLLKDAIFLRNSVRGYTLKDQVDTKNFRIKTVLEIDKISQILKRRN